MKPKFVSLKKINKIDTFILKIKQKYINHPYWE